MHDEGGGDDDGKMEAKRQRTDKTSDKEHFNNSQIISINAQTAI